MVVMDLKQLHFQIRKVIMVLPEDFRASVSNVEHGTTEQSFAKANAGKRCKKSN